MNVSVEHTGYVFRVEEQAKPPVTNMQATSTAVLLFEYFFVVVGLTLKMEEVYCFETTVNFFRATLRHIST
jgi:hypothetical protein